ncbi:MAG TPA: 16S rRNA (cytosine(1402)-N(4))-methyltransferase, partial [Chloroflexota bacterium]|nr:16S rRNA (cytosine(1402)-N(4))-methyltransferase [Chloroflexota bacterium]
MATNPPPEPPAPHLPVLPAETIDWLRPRPGCTYVDCTVGAGGHARAILDASQPDGRLLGLDVDADALSLAAETLRPYGERALLVQRNFRELESVLAATGTGAVHGVLLDLGVSSMQLDRPQRGFS